MLNNKEKDRLRHKRLKNYTDKELHQMRNSSNAGSKLLFLVVREQARRGLLVTKEMYAKGSYGKPKIKNLKDYPNYP